jgi:hypothetical protein
MKRVPKQSKGVPAAVNRKLGRHVEAFKKECDSFANGQAATDRWERDCRWFAPYPSLPPESRALISDAELPHRIAFIVHLVRFDIRTAYLYHVEKVARGSMAGVIVTIMEAEANESGPLIGTTLSREGVLIRAETLGALQGRMDEDCPYLTNALKPSAIPVGEFPLIVETRVGIAVLYRPIPDPAGFTADLKKFEKAEVARVMAMKGRSYTIPFLVADLDHLRVERHPVHVDDEGRLSYLPWPKRRLPPLKP